MSKFDTSHFVKKKILVTEPDKTMTFTTGRKRADTATGDVLPEETGGAFTLNGCLFLIGCEGSGRKRLGELLAATYYVPLEVPESLPDAGAVRQLCSQPCQSACSSSDSGGGGVIVVPPDAVRSPEVRDALREHGNVFYLMGEVLHFARRLGIAGDDRNAHAALAAAFVELEPLFMETLHYILQGWKEPEELVENVQEMLAMV